MTEKTADVLVVGAGLAGLSTAMFLAQHGVRTLVVEKHADVSIHPRAAGQNPRTMELLRIGGVDEQVRRASDIRGESGEFTIKVVETVGGTVLHTYAESFEALVAATAPATPMSWALASQDRVEPLLLARARENGATALFSTELTDFEQDGDGVRARLLDRRTGEASTTRARYLVAADGPASQIRERLGVGRHGHGSLTHFVGVIFEADLSEVAPPGSTGWYYIRNPAFTGAFGPTDRPDRHTFFVEYAPDQGQSAEHYTEQRCAELIRIALNAPDLKPRLLDTQAWEMAAWIAERWRVGRVFLAGDAAKVAPPTGGLGGNTAIGDGFDLAWKLAWSLRGEAGPGLLDTYEPERRAVAELVVDESMSVYAHRMAPHLIDTAPSARGLPEVILGFRCRSAGILSEDEDPAPTEDPLRPTGRPGFRGPHVWLPRPDGGRMSTLDLFGRSWVLIAGRAGAAWGPAARLAADDLGVRLETRRVGVDLDDPEDLVGAAYGIGQDGASLVRPDGIVAWRAERMAADAVGTLRAALAQTLFR